MISLQESVNITKKSGIFRVSEVISLLLADVSATKRKEKGFAIIVTYICFQNFWY
jgi:hypothetical protein